MRNSAYWVACCLVWSTGCVAPSRESAALQKNVADLAQGLVALQHNLDLAVCDPQLRSALGDLVEQCAEYARKHPPKAPSAVAGSAASAAGAASSPAGFTGDDASSVPCPLDALGAYVQNWDEGHPGKFADLLCRLPHQVIYFNASGPMLPSKRVNGLKQLLAYPLPSTLFLLATPPKAKEDRARIDWGLERLKAEGIEPGQILPPVLFKLPPIESCLRAPDVPGVGEQDAQPLWFFRATCQLHQPVSSASPPPPDGPNQVIKS